jgi:hypothetical protein
MCVSSTNMYPLMEAAAEGACRYARAGGVGTCVVVWRGMCVGGVAGTGTGGEGRWRQ